MQGRASGGAHTSRTMLLADLTSVLASCPVDSTQEDYKRAIIDGNAAGKGSLSSRQRTFRYLRELYIFDIQEPVFRAFLRLWALAPEARPQVAFVLAASRDPALRATASGVLPVGRGEPVTSSDLSEAVEREFPGAYSTSIRDKIGRNALSSWTQAGYLSRAGRKPALRVETPASAAAVAMAAAIGEAEGLAGERLFGGPAAAVLGCSIATLHDRAHEASRKGWLEYRSGGQITEIDAAALTADLGDPRLPLEEATE